MSDFLSGLNINTPLLVAALVFLVRQSRMVDALRQSLLGVEGRGGALEEIKLLRERSHDLANKMTTLTLTVEQLTEVMEDRKQRRER